MSDRPTIDGYEIIIPSELDIEAYKYNGEYISADFARKLKRENSELRKQLEQARTTAEYWKAEHLEGNAKLEQAEARCKHYETALEKCFPIIENMRAIIREEDTKDPPIAGRGDDHPSLADGG